VICIALRCPVCRAAASTPLLACLPSIATTVAHGYSGAGRFTVTAATAQTAAGQDPNRAGDLIGAFVFS
jgi:hypothetical protein